MSDVDALIVALADGRTMHDAARAARMTGGKAVQAAREFGWPDMDAIRLAAEEIRERHAVVVDPDDQCDHCALPLDACRAGTPCCPDCTHTLPGGEPPVPPRTKTREPIPVEPDVEDAITRGARQAEASRQALATSTEARDARAEELLAEREHVAREVPGFFDPVVFVDEPEGQPQPAAEATDAKPCAHAAHHLDKGARFEPGDHVSVDGLFGTAIPCSGCSGAALVLDPDEIQPGPPPPGVEPLPADWAIAIDRHAAEHIARAAQAEAADAPAYTVHLPGGGITKERLQEGLRRALRPGTDTALMEDTAAVLQLLDRAAEPQPLDALDVDQRARAVALREVADGFTDATVGETLALADWVITGIVPVVLITGGAR